MYEGRSDDNGGVNVRPSGTIRKVGSKGTGDAFWAFVLLLTRTQGKAKNRRRVMTQRFLSCLVLFL